MVKLKSVKKTKALALFSGGLDSCLTIKLLQEQGLDVEALYIKLPFAADCCTSIEGSFNFTQMQDVKLHILDCSKGKLLKEYLNLIKNPKYGRGSGYNPCKDCKIFLFQQGKNIAKKIGAEIIATGEVIGQRPMSQMKKSLMLDEEQAGLKHKILRPLSAKLLPKTIYEEKGLVDREKFLSIHGRSRKIQMKLAEKYKIKYPTPAGGCLLCEKFLKKRFEILLKRGLDSKTSRLINVGRHFMIDKAWLILGRDHEENKILENLKCGKVIEPDFPGPSVLVFGEIAKKQVLELIKSYSKKGSLKDRETWDKYKI